MYGSNRALYSRDYSVLFPHIELLHHNSEVCWWKHYNWSSFSVWVQTINKNGKEYTDQEMERF
jgi:hypothetical protein